MKVTNESETLYSFKAWQGGKDTQEVIIKLGLDAEFESLIDELYPEGLTDVSLNDLLWFESDWIYESIGIVSKDDVLDLIADRIDTISEVDTLESILDNLDDPGSMDIVKGSPEFLAKYMLDMEYFYDAGTGYYSSSEIQDTIYKMFENMGAFNFVTYNSDDDIYYLILDI